MFAGEPYNALDPELLAERARCRALVERYNATAFADGKRRSALLDEILGDRGEDTLVMAPFQCDYGYRIRIGAHTFINYGAVMLDAAEVVIGEHVQIGPNVQLITALHPLDAHDTCDRDRDGRTGHDRGPRLARRRSDRLPRRHDRRRVGDRGGQCRHPLDAGCASLRRQPVSRGPGALTFAP